MGCWTHVIYEAYCAYDWIDNKTSKRHCRTRWKKCPNNKCYGCPYFGVADVNKAEYKAMVKAWKEGNFHEADLAIKENFPKHKKSIQNHKKSIQKHKKSTRKTQKKKVKK